MSAAREAPVFDEWGRSPHAPLAIRLGAASLAGYLRLAYATGRAEVLQPDFHVRAMAAPGGTYIGVFWHRVIGLTTAFYPPSIPRACLVSRSRDGELLARMVAQLGSRAVRGSSSSLDGRTKGGAAALRGLVRSIGEGFHVIVTPDGPRGPAEHLKPGVVLLGSITGCPIVPLGVAVSRFCRLSTWDGTLIPLPFARFVLSYGEPLQVPADTEAAAFEASRAELERRLKEADAHAWAHLGMGRPR